MDITTYVSLSAKETELIGESLAKMVMSPAFIALYGDLGAGKTAFVRGMVRAFDQSAIVTSPTYNIVNEYKLDDFSLYHFDMYRITDDDDLYSVGFYDYLDAGILVCEWSENIPYAIPDEHIRVKIKKCDTDDNKREITVEFLK